MNVGAVVTTVGRVFRRRPADLLPFYLLGAAVPLFGQVIGIAGITLIAVYLEVTGRLETALSAAGDIGPPPEVEPEDDPDELLEWLEGFEPIFEALVSPVTTTILLGSVLLAVGVVVFVSAIMTAGQLGTCFARLKDRRGLTSGIGAARRFWPAMLTLYLLELFAHVVLLGLVFVVVSLAAAAAGPAGAVLGVLFAGGLWLILALVLRAIFAFAPVAVVVDEVGSFESLSNAAGFIVRNPAEALVYYVAAIAAIVGVAIAGTVLAVVGAQPIVGLVSPLIILPLLDLLKTGFYADHRDGLLERPPIEASYRQQFRAGTRRGYRELTDFVRAYAHFHAFSLAVILVGFVIGWLAADRIVDLVDTSIEARLEGQIAPGAALGYFGNNWLVALTTAFSGVALAIPTIGVLWFNGVVFGLYGRTEVDPEILAAFVLPHGIFEIPAIIVAGAVGVFLGRAWFQTALGRADREAFADALERAFWVLVGVGILMAIAAIIEGFLSPYYFRPLL